MLYNTKWLGVFCALLAGGPIVRASARLEELASVIRAVEPEGRGNPEASRAWQSLASSDAADLPEVLAAMDGANDLALNWLRAAAENIADRALNAGRPLPFEPLQRFLLDTRHHPRARRLAFELMARAKPEAADALVAGMVNDPSPELRRQAVQKLIDQAAQTLASGDKAGAASLFQQSLGHARDVDQVDGIAKHLRELGQPVDLPRVFGFIMKWKVIGPFDNSGGKGFAAVYPPEQAINLEDEADGKSGRGRWIDLETTDEHGVLSMNKPFGALKGAAGYALAEFHSEAPRAVELRLGSENAWKLWLNGQYLFGQNEYHRNKAMDQFVMQAQLRKGRNLILVKVCQNEQTEDWAGDWDFQLRVCDATGTAIYSLREPLKEDSR